MKSLQKLFNKTENEELFDDAPSKIEKVNEELRELNEIAKSNNVSQLASNNRSVKMIGNNQINDLEEINGRERR